MKQLLLVTIIVSSLFLSAFNIADSLKIKVQEQRIEVLSNTVQEIRRDQLNYKIEKDLLKEAYTTNWQTLNQVLTVLLAIAGITGYIGIRDIFKIKSQYTKELASLKVLQVNIENKSKEFEIAKTDINTEIRELIENNEIQNNKIKTLEIKEKIQALFKEKKYSLALEFCIAGSQLNPEDLTLIHFRASCQTMLRSYSEAIGSYKKIVSIDPNNIIAIYNLGEVLIFSNRIEEFRSLIEQNKGLLNKESDPVAFIIYETLISYQSKDTVRLKEKIVSFIKAYKMDIKERHMGWSLNDAQAFLSNEKESYSREIMTNFFSYLDGYWSGNDLLAKLKN